MSRIVESLYQKYNLNESKQKRNKKRKLNEDSSFQDLAFKKFKNACKKYNVEDPKIEFSNEGVMVYSPSFANFKYEDFDDFGEVAGIGYMEEAGDDYAFFDPELFESKQNKRRKRKLNESVDMYMDDIDAIINEWKSVKQCLLNNELDRAEKILIDLEDSGLLAEDILSEIYL